MVQMLAPIDTDNVLPDGFSQLADEHPVLSGYSAHRGTSPRASRSVRAPECIEDGDPGDVISSNETLYLLDLRRASPVSPQAYERAYQVLALARRGHPVSAAAHEQARQCLILTYAPKVAWLAWRYARTARYLDWLDLIQEGNAALIALIDSFPFEEGRDLSGYVYKRVKGALVKACYTEDPICLPPWFWARARVRHGCEPREVARRLRPVSLDAPLSGDAEEVTLLEITARPLVESASCSPEKVALLRALLAWLPEQERAVLALRTGLNPDQVVYSRAEIARLLNVTPESVRHRERSALARLHRLIQEHQPLVHAYLTGDSSMILSLQERLHARSDALQERGARVQLSEDEETRLTRAYEQLQHAGARITVHALARTAHVKTEYAMYYLRRFALPAQERLARAYDVLKQAGANVTGQALAKAAHVRPATASQYLRERTAAQEGSQ